MSTQYQRLRAFWANVLSFYNEPPNELKVNVLAHDCLKHKLSISQLEFAFEQYRKHDKLSKAPTFAHILEYTQLKENQIEELAKKDADDILRLVKVFGWTEGELAMQQLSTHAVNFVNSIGGWQHLCAHLGTSLLPLGVFLSQAYESCKASRAREKTELHNRQIEERKQLLENSDKKTRIVEKQ